jgi:plastocyanin
MTTVDKAAIGWSIAIVAIGVAIAFAGAGGQDLSVGTAVPQATSPTTTTPTVEEPEAQTDPFADIAADVKKSASSEETKPKPKPVTEPVKEAMPEPVEEVMPEPVEEAMPEPTGPQTVMVDMPAGTAVPGCEETNECYIPASITINAGDTVQWTNSDTAAHTVTGGSTAEGPSGVFDSSLVLGGASYSFTFEEAGNYDYFCMVHPWMVGNVQVN